MIFFADPFAIHCARLRCASQTDPCVDPSAASPSALGIASAQPDHGYAVCKGRAQQTRHNDSRPSPNARTCR